ncbi:MAG: SEC-C domain-containing protein [Pirellulales bacterium]|nr:SEC-C domain-containing protein [Pirellulales bacterium]
MAVDPYAPCPCGSGKKLKFCCSDLVADIEKISKLVAGDQPHAALKHVAHLLEKEPNRTSLLDMRAMLELSVDEMDAAEKTIRHFLQIDPENPSAHAQAAVLAAMRDEVEQAVAKLQDALERTDNAMPQRVFEAIGAVGHALLLAGDIVAARAHLTLYAGVAPAGDTRGMDLLVRLNLQSGLPLLLRDNLQLQEPPSQFANANKAAFNEGNRLARRGLWRRAEAEFQKLLNEANPQPPVVYNLALVQGWLGDDARFAVGMHRYARLNIPFDDAVEAEALAQLVDPSLEEPQLASVRLVYPLANEDAAAERLASDKRIERYELDPESLDEDEVTRPRSTHLLLDRPVPPSGVDLALEDAPSILAFLSVYGKRTDREAQLMVTTDQGKQFDEVQSLIREILGDAIGEEVQVHSIGERLLSEEALSWRWRLPNDTPLEHRRELLRQRRRRAIFEDWAATPLAGLGGLSAREAAGRPELRIPLAAAVVIVEQAASDPNERAMFQELREQLGLPRQPAINPENLDFDRLPLIRIPRLDLTNLPMDRLLRLFHRAGLSGAGLAMLALAQEIVSRDTSSVEIGAVFRYLIRAEPDPDQALNWIARAKHWAEQSNRKTGEWALLELEVQIERGDPAGVQNVFDEIRANHMNEPGVAEAIFQLLHSSGLLQHPGGPDAGPIPAPGAASQPAGRLWTPDQATSSPSAPAGGKQPVIWTP